MAGFDLQGSLGDIFGLRLVKDSNRVIDSGERSWRRVRSPGRARRRMKQGHRQNIDVIWIPDPSLYRVGNTIIGHPAMIQKVIDAAKEPTT